MSDKMITIEHFPRNIFLRILLFPFASIQHTVSIDGGNAYLYQVMKIVFGRVVVVHTVLAKINTNSEAFKSMNQDITETVIKNIQIVGPEGNS